MKRRMKQTSETSCRIAPLWCKFVAFVAVAPLSTRGFTSAPTCTHRLMAATGGTGIYKGALVTRRSSLYASTSSSSTASEDSSISKHEQQEQGDALEAIEASSAALEKPSSGGSTSGSSKRDMLTFAIPALGIYLCNPLLSNIDNAFVGRTVGTAGLAALSPATVCTDQMLYLFSFLPRATTGLVALAYSRSDKEKTPQEAASEAASTPLTVALICGIALSLLYAVGTPAMLQAFRVSPSLVRPASAYIYIRGAIAWAALAQSVSLSVLMATRDAITPLKIIAMAALLNVVGDALFCVAPFQWGCAGASAATSLATLVSSSFLLRALKRKKLLPRIQWPQRKSLVGLLEYTGPLLAITLTRLAGFLVMQRSAMALGVQNLAAYQLCINVVMFFLLFGEPLSQLSQTRLPGLIQSQEGGELVASLNSILSLAAVTALGVGGVAYSAAAFGASLFSADIIVQGLARQAAPAVFLSVATAVFTVAVDGAMLASRDFGFMLLIGLSTFVAQVKLLQTKCSSLSFVFGTFTMRLAVYALLALGRAALGYGALGKATISTVEAT